MKRVLLISALGFIVFHSNVVNCAVFATPNPRAQDPLIVSLPPIGTFTWGNWSFTYTFGAYSEGLELRNVRFKGIKVIHKASIPVIRVKYRGDASSLEAGCGPYLDRIDFSCNVVIMKGAVTQVVARFYDSDLVEIAAFSEIGDYDLYQAWYFRKSGRLEPRLYSRGWACGHDEHENDHRHHPYWRIDFDVESPSNEIFEVRTKTNGTTLTTKLLNEGNTSLQSGEKELAWIINKPGSSKHVLIRYPENERRDSGGTPWFNFSSKEAAWRRFKSSENIGWDFDDTQHLEYMSPSESTNGQDIVFWLVGHLSHPWTISDLLDPHWHSTGAIIDLVNF